MFRNRFIICALLTLPVLYLAEPVQQLLGYRPPVLPGLGWVSLLLTTVIYLYGGLVFVRGGLAEIAARQPGMMTLVGLATTVGYTYSLAVALGLPGTPFYWELATLIDVMLLGHWLEMLAVQGASRVLEELASILPQTAHVVMDGHVADVPAAELRPGVVVLVRPGEQIPADGVVIEGSSSVNEAFLTGESRPVPKQVGDEVAAGSINGEGALKIRVTRTGEDTAVSQVMRLVREAWASRSRFQTVADRVAGWLTLVAVGAGAATFAAWLISAGELAFALERAVTVLVVACPHALGLAVPLVVVNATALAAARGIIIRNREAFERAREINVVAFDKTGTLTEGRFGVEAVVAADGVDPTEALALAAAVEAFSEHALAQAIVAAARDRNLPVPTAADVRAVPGRGVEGRVNGRTYRVGRPEWFAELGLSFPESLSRALAEADARGQSPVVVGDEGRALAVISLADRIRPSAREAVRRLKSAGVEVVMVTGDAEAVARTVAEALGVTRYHARVLPADKARIVESVRAEGKRVAFVGDGINDAPALLAADLGVAIGAGTNVAIESADLVLVKNDPLDVVRILELSRTAYAKMVQNLLWATGYNAVAIPLAAGVAYRAGIVLSPAVGALLMSLSTIIVALNAMLMRRK
jgi:Cu2+-exporting ATPase